MCTCDTMRSHTQNGTFYHVYVVNEELRNICSKIFKFHAKYFIDLLERKSE